MKTLKPTTRRNFLLAAGLGGAGAVAAVATSRKKGEVAAGADPAASDGYRASPHILKYYKTTEV
jgi:hypothetical protein